MLILKRFCGDEIYPLANANWCISGGELKIDMRFSRGTQLHEDTKYLAEEPSWWIYFSNITDDSILKKGLVLENSNESEDDAFLYYCEHNPTYHNRLEILDRINDQLLIRLSAVCCDVNYYDGSKGTNKMEITAWISQK